MSIRVYDAAGYSHWWNVTTASNGDFVLGPLETGDVNFGATEIGWWSATAYITVNSVVYQAGPVYWQVKWFPPHETGRAVPSATPPALTSSFPSKRGQIAPDLDSTTE